MGVSKNRGTPKSSILIRFSIINHPFWGTPILETPTSCNLICSTDASEKNPGETPPPGIEKVHRCHSIGNLKWLGLNWIEVIIMSLKFVTLLEESSLTYESIYIYIYVP